MQMYYHGIETELKRQMTKIVITRIQHAFEWDFPCKTKVKMGDHYSNSDCDEIFGAIICRQKATHQVFSDYFY